jgi:hypothetical protein
MSNIVAVTIDEDFPIAGQDNDSQGFRDNFSIIKAGLSTAASEITNLENTTAKLTEANNFNSTVISNAEVNQLYGTVYGPVTQEATSSIAVDYTLGEYQEIVVTGNLLLTFEGFPDQTESGGAAIEPGKRVYAKIRLALSGSGGVAHTVSFGTVKKSGYSVPFTVSTDANAVRIVDVWQLNGAGSIPFVHYVGEFV